MISNNGNLTSFFELTSLPFTRELFVEKRWKHPVCEEILGELRSAVTQRMSAAIIGPAGTGKTVLLRALKESLPEVRYRVHYVKVTRLCSRDFCREVATALGCTSAGYYGALVRKIQERAETLMDHESLRPILVLDEAHDIKPEVLAILRILTNFDMDSRLVVSVILAGQPTLERTLRKDELESVRRRLAHYVSLRLLSRDETREYIHHRLNIAGAKTDIFDQGALDAIYEITQGNLRAIDRIALKSMEQAFKKNNRVVGTEHVLEGRKKVLL